MSFLEAAASDALAMLAGFDMDAAVALGMQPNRARSLADVHSTYLAPTHAHKQQAKAVSLVREAGLSLDHLVYLEGYLKQLPVRERGAKRLEALDAVAKARPKNYNAYTRTVKAAVPIEQKPPEETAKFGRGRMGLAPILLWMDEHDAADIYHAASEHTDPDKPLGPQLLKNLVGIFRANTGEGAEGAMPVPFSVPRPIVSVPLADWVAIHEGEGDEVTLGLSDGTTMTGAEFIERFVATAENHLEIALVKPGYGAVNLYDTSRFANDKQRTLASLVNPVCPWPGCKSPAAHNQAHHVTPWKQGGPTNLNNLVMVCRYHNYVNDDDVGKQKRGRIEIRDGEGVWVSPGGVPVSNDYHPYGVMRTV